MEKSRGTTGRLIEHEVLGEVTKPEKFEHWREHWEKHRYENRIPYEKAIEEVKKLQPDQDPSYPSKELPSELLWQIADQLDLDIDNSLRYYTAVHFGELDYRFGIDAFFEWIQEDGKIIRVTIDLTTDVCEINPQTGRTRKRSKAEQPIKDKRFEVTSSRPNNKEWIEADVYIPWPRAGLDRKLPLDKERWQRLANYAAKEIIEVFRLKQQEQSNIRERRKTNAV